MSEIVERMCRAVVAKANERGEYDNPASEWTVDDFKCHHIWEDQMAALEAMREPTEAMLKAPEMATWAWRTDERVEPEEIADAWRSMIDEALK